MKKLITILMAVCLMVSVLGISALAEYTGPVEQTRPAMVDFNNENIGQNYNQYYTTNPINWFYLQCYGNIVEDATDSTNRYLHLSSTTGVAAAAGIRFNAFNYDSTVAEGQSQPEKLVISFEADYPTITSNINLLSGYNHVNIGVADEAKFVNNRGTGTATTSPFTSKALWFDYTVDTATSKVSGPTGGSGRSFGATEFDSNAFLNTLNNGGKVYYTFVLDHTRDAEGYGNFVIYINGTKCNPKKFYSVIDTINGVSFGIQKANLMNIDNVRIFTVDNEKVTVTGQSVAATEVPYTTDAVSVNFSHEIIDAADRYITVKKGDTTLTAGVDYTLEHVAETTGAKTNKTLKVNFTNELAYDTTYSVVASASYFGLDGIALGEETTLASFTTEAAPQINLSAFTLKKGVFGNTAITDLSDALGSTVCVTTTATNADIRGAAAGTVFFGVYKNDVLVSLAYVNKNFATDETDEISVNVKLPAAESTDTVAIKAFVCEGITNITPYGTPIQVSTAD